MHVQDYLNKSCFQYYYFKLNTYTLMLKQEVLSWDVYLHSLAVCPISSPKYYNCINFYGQIYLLLKILLKNLIPSHFTSDHYLTQNMERKQAFQVMSHMTHFKSLLNSKSHVDLTADSNERGQLDYIITLDELKKAFAILKPGKTLGIDNLRNEMILSTREPSPSHLKIIQFHTRPQWNAGLDGRNNHTHTLKWVKGWPIELQRNIPFMLLEKTFPF